MEQTGENPTVQHVREQAEPIVGEAVGERGVAGMSLSDDAGPECLAHDENADGAEYWSALAARLRERRLTEGFAHADAQWVADPFRSWSDNLERGEGRLSHEHAAALVVGMHESLAIRDALIVSLVTRHGECDECRMIAFAANPHDPGNVRGMYRLLEQAFNDEYAMPEVRRCRSGLAMVEGIVAMAPDRLQVQPLALMGYIHWWMGEDEGLPFALRALRHDAGCTLAAIVRSAYEHDIHPASARRCARQ